MGNEFIALAAYHAGVNRAYSYPGTPSSEILDAYSRFASEKGYAQWSLNEKIALELAAAEAICGSYSMCSMKQVGLNVAADPLFSIAYTGIKGALIVVSADDPGPYSSQTEQDSRMYAFSAKIPVFDPLNPLSAYDLTKKGVELSSKYEIPVMIRPVMRVCHSRQSAEISFQEKQVEYSSFERDVARWAATPKFRRMLHEKLNEKLSHIASEIYKDFKVKKRNRYAVIGSGYAFGMVLDILKETELPVDSYFLEMPFPIDEMVINDLLKNYEKILVVEETQPLIEMQFANMGKVVGRLSGFFSGMGEFSFDYLYEKLFEFLDKDDFDKFEKMEEKPGVKPRLCPGCGHRPAFYAIKKVGGKNGIFPGDIGCYTLGVNLGAVDTCICMGASVSFAEGISRSNPEKPVIATIGDSTFFHTGIPALVNAVANNAGFVLCILDNDTTAMTGFQPVPHSHDKIKIEKVVNGIGVEFCKTVDPYNLDESISVLEEAIQYSKESSSPSVIIFKHPCVTQIKFKGDKRIVINEKCKNCRICYEKFECPALYEDKLNDKAEVNRLLCVDCGVCVQVCPFDAIVFDKGDLS